MSDLTTKAIKVSRRICEIEERLACLDLTGHEADDLRYEKAELEEWDEVLSAYFNARNNCEQLQQRVAELEGERDALAAHVERLSEVIDITSGYCPDEVWESVQYDAISPQTSLAEVRAKQAEESYAEGFSLGHKIGYEAPKEEIEQAHRTHTAIDMLKYYRERAARAHADKHAQQISNSKGGE